MTTPALIVTSSSIEVLTSELLLRMGLPASFAGQKVYVAKACLDGECWRQLLGPAELLESLPHATALQAIKLGQQLRSDRQVDGALIVTGDLPAALTAYKKDRNVRWSRDTVAQVFTAGRALPMTHVLSEPEVMHAAYLANKTKKLVDAALSPRHALWKLPPVLVGAVMRRITQHTKGVNRLLNQIYAGKPPFPVTSEQVEALKMADVLKETVAHYSQAEEEYYSPGVLLDPDHGEGFAPKMIAARGRLDRLQQQIQAGEPANDIAMQLVRELDAKAFTLLGIIHTDGNWPLHPVAPLLADEVRAIFRDRIHYSPDHLLCNQTKAPLRAIWHQMSEMYAKEGITGVLSQLKRNYWWGESKEVVIQLLAGTATDCPAYPLSDDEREHCRRYLAAAEQRRKEAEARHIQQQHWLPKAQRQQALTALMPTIAELGAMTPARRSMAIIKNEDYWRSRWDELEPAWQSAAEALKIRRQQQAQAREQKKQQQLASIPLPVSRYLALQDTGQGIHVVFAPNDDLTLKSNALRQDLLYIVNRRLKAGRLTTPAGKPDIQLTRFPGQVELWVDRADIQKLTRVVADVDQKIDDWRTQPLAPFHIDEVLGISKAERTRWAKDGKFKVVGHDSFVRGRTVIDYPLYSRSQVCSITPDTIEHWRRIDAAATATRRKTGAARAVQSRERNTRMRKDERQRINEIARDVARGLGDLRLVWVVKLRIYGLLAQCWANRLRDQRKTTEADALLQLKQRAFQATAPAIQHLNLPADYLQDLMGDPFDGMRSYSQLTEEQMLLYPLKMVEESALELLELYEPAGDGEHIAGTPAPVQP